MSELNILPQMTSNKLNRDAPQSNTSKSGSQAGYQNLLLNNGEKKVSQDRASPREDSYLEGMKQQMDDEFGVKKNWTIQEQQSLLSLHNSIGNCWTSIANTLSKGHNTVKNHFYAEIRKSVRRINFFIPSCFPKKHKELNLAQISKAITLLSQKKREIPNLSGLGVFSDDQINSVKFELFRYAKFSENDLITGEEKEKLGKLLDAISDILNQLKNRGLIGKKNSAFKQARQAKLKKLCQNMPQKPVTMQKDPIKEEKKESFNSIVKLQEPDMHQQINHCDCLNNVSQPNNIPRQSETQNTYCNDYFYMFSYPFQLMVNNQTMNGWSLTNYQYPIFMGIQNNQCNVFSGQKISSFNLFQRGQNTSS